jgi:AraC-like DNA-binding protein
MSDHLLVFLSDPLEQAVVRETLGKEHRIHLCASYQEAIAIIAVAAPSNIISDLTPGTSRGLWEIMEYSWKARQIIPRLLLRTSLDILPSKDLVRLAHRYAHASVSLRGFDDFAADTRDAVSAQPVQAADLIIIDRVSTSPLTPGLEIVVRTILAGKRRMEVRRFARLSRTPVRTLESRLRAERLPAARRLLGWSASLHALWRIETQQMPLKQAAMIADFPSAEAIAHYVRRNVGASPAQLRRAGGFEGLLDRFAALISAQPRPSR